ncbi:MAG: HmuY family protein [Leptospiraceae bacterium]|nr:HmuY family protein [Leptospiraceae bacterium]
MKPGTILLIAILFTHCARLSDTDTAKRNETNNFLLQAVSGGLEPIGTRPELISNSPQSDGSTITQVRATSNDLWTNYSFATSALSNTEFDIGFQRFKVRTNGGATNNANQGAACRSNTSTFPGASTSSASLGCTNTEFKNDINGQAQVIGGGGASFTGSDVLTNFDTGWFLYDIPTLSPRLTVFIIRSSNGTRFYAVQIIDYYSDAGTSGYPKFRWREISP